MRRLAFIPARGGSKGIKRKNLRQLNGVSLVKRAAQDAQKSCLFDEVFVSTDDEEIAEECKDIHKHSEYRRPGHLAQDNSSVADALMHAINWLQKKNNYFDTYTLIQTTSPLRTCNDIIKAQNLFEKSGNNTFASVSLVQEHPAEVLIVKNEKVSPLLNEENLEKNRQNYDNHYYFINGALYGGYVKNFILSQRFIDLESVFLYKMNAKNSLDIDEEYQLVMAEALFNFFRNNK